MLDTFFARPRRVFGAIAVICAAMLAFGILYLQNVVGLEPCPMCIVQRYALIIVGVFCAIAFRYCRPPTSSALPSETIAS